MNLKNLEILLRSRYDEPWRHYHTWEHVTRMLEGFEKVAYLSDHPLAGYQSEAIEWAVKFHDVVYEPTAGNNEERSAQLARVWLGSLLTESSMNEVERLILLTKTHEPKDCDINGFIMCDLDLMVMGWDREEFDDFGRRIRLEYSHVSDEDFRHGRKAFMKSFRARPQIFHTRHFFDRFEEQARENINRTIAVLS